MARITKTHLKNGIPIITEEMPDVESATVGLWVKTGARDESEEIRGVSHFIEHLLFKGTKKRTAFDIAKSIEAVGGVLNAFTSREYTCFYAKVLNKDLPLAIDLLSDIVVNSVFDAKELNRERGVVLQEIRMVEDTPDDLVHDLIAEKIWNGGSYGSPILGTKKTVEEMGRESVLEYYKENYQAKKMLVTIAGGLKTTKVVKLLEASLGSVVSGEDKKPSKTPASASGSKLVKRDLEQVHLCLGVPAVSQAHPHRFRYYLLNTILGGGMSSRLFQEIREKRGLAYSIYSYLSFSEKAGSLVVYAGTSSEEFKGVLRLIIREFGKVGKDISRAELKAAKDHLKGGMLLGLESSDSRMMKLARDEIYFGKSISIKEIVSGIDKVRGSDIKKTAKEIFKPKNLTLVAIGKGKSEDLPKYLRG